MRSYLARFILWILGWKIDGERPDDPKFIALIVPHTSNWDFFYMLMLVFAKGSGFQWLGMGRLFDGVLGPILRFFGGIPVREGTNMVETVASEFSKNNRFILAIAPEGALKQVDYWKTGFYYMALEANVPILMAYIDYPTKTVGVGEIMHPSGDIEADMRIFQAHYEGKVGKYPEKMSPIRLKSDE